MNKLDEQFVKIMLTVQKQYQSLSKHSKIRVQQWTKKLCQPTNNIQWKKNRNNYARLLLVMVHSNRMEQPFNKMPRPGPLPNLPSHLMPHLPVKFPIEQHQQDSLPSIDPNQERAQQLLEIQSDINQRLFSFLTKYQSVLSKDPQYSQLINQLGGRRPLLGSDILNRQMNQYQKQTNQLIKLTNQAINDYQQIMKK